MTVHTTNGHIVNVEAQRAGLNLMIECDEGICEQVELPMTQQQWHQIVAQGFAALGSGL